MADFCALCGAKLSFFGSHALVCANQDEVFCSDCHDKLYPMDNLERGRFVLEHGNPDEPKKMKEFITHWEERAKQKLTFEPPTRPCPTCGGEMRLAIKDFTIGAYADSLLGDRYEVDLYACPECGKVEMYTANFAAVKRREEKQAAAKAARAAAQAEKEAQLEQELAARKEAQREYTTYRPGRKSNEKPPWER